MCSIDHAAKSPPCFHSLLVLFPCLVFFVFGDINLFVFSFLLDLLSVLLLFYILMS